MTKQAKYVPVVECPLFNAEGVRARFNLVFYGIPLNEFLQDAGGHRVREALERRGITHLVTSPFHIFERRFSW